MLGRFGMHNSDLAFKCKQNTSGILSSQMTNLFAIKMNSVRGGVTDVSAYEQRTLIHTADSARPIKQYRLLLNTDRNIRHPALWGG